MSVKLGESEETEHIKALRSRLRDLKKLYANGLVERGELEKVSDELEYATALRKDPNDPWGSGPYGGLGKNPFEPDSDHMRMMKKLMEAQDIEKNKIRDEDFKRYLEQQKQDLINKYLNPKYEKQEEPMPPKRKADDFEKELVKNILADVLTNNLKCVRRDYEDAYHFTLGGTIPRSLMIQDSVEPMIEHLESLKRGLGKIIDDAITEIRERNGR